GVGHLAERCAGLERLAHRWQQVAGSICRRPHVRECGVDGRLVPRSPKVPHPRDLRRDLILADPLEHGLTVFFGLEPVHPDDDPIAALDRLLDLAGGLAYRVTAEAV